MLTLKKPSAPAAEDSVKGKRLLRGRTVAHVTRLIGEIDTAREAIAQAQEHLNDRMVEGADTTDASDALIRAENHLRTLESVLTIAHHKHEQAEAGLKQAETEVRREVAREKLRRQQELGRVIDQALDNLAPAVREYIRSSKEVTDLGNDELNRRTFDAQREFIVWLFRACSDMPGCRTGTEPFQTDARWKAPWSDRLPSPDLVDEVIR